MKYIHLILIVLLNTVELMIIKNKEISANTHLKTLVRLIRKKQYMQCLVLKNSDLPLDEACKNTPDLSSEEEHYSLLISKIVRDVVYAKKTCVHIDEKVTYRSCKKLVRRDFIHFFHIKISKNKKRGIIKKVVTSFMHYLKYLEEKRELLAVKPKEQLIRPDIGQLVQNRLNEVIAKRNSTQPLNITINIYSGQKNSTSTDNPIFAVSQVTPNVNNNEGLNFVSQAVKRYENSAATREQLKTDRSYDSNENGLLFMKTKPQTDRNKVIFDTSMGNIDDVINKKGPMLIPTKSKTPSLVKRKKKVKPEFQVKLKRIRKNPKEEDFKIKVNTTADSINSLTEEDSKDPSKDTTTDKKSDNNEEGNLEKREIGSSEGVDKTKHIKFNKNNSHIKRNRHVDHLPIMTTKQHFKSNTETGTGEDKKNNLIGINTEKYTETEKKEEKDKEKEEKIDEKDEEKDDDDDDDDEKPVEEVKDVKKEIKDQHKKELETALKAEEKKTNEEEKSEASSENKSIEDANNNQINKNNMGDINNKNNAEKHTDNKQPNIPETLDATINDNKTSKENTELKKDNSQEKETSKFPMESKNNVSDDKSTNKDDKNKINKSNQKDTNNTDVTTTKNIEDKTKDASLVKTTVEDNKKEEKEEKKENEKQPTNNVKKDCKTINILSTVIIASILAIIY